MTKDEIQKNSEHWYNKYKDAEKRITELENKIADIKANCDLAIEGRDIKIKELEQENAGLKAGRPQWHKVADGDLPKENKLYFVAIKENGLAIAYFNGRHWETKYNLGDFGHCVETVIAWCEIPTFDKEEEYDSNGFRQNIAFG